MMLVSIRDFLFHSAWPCLDFILSEQWSIMLVNKIEQVFLEKFERDFHAMRVESQVKSLWIKTIAKQEQLFS